MRLKWNGRRKDLGRCCRMPQVLVLNTCLLPLKNVLAEMLNPLMIRRLWTCHGQIPGNLVTSLTVGGGLGHSLRVVRNIPHLVINLTVFNVTLRSSRFGQMIDLAEQLCVLRLGIKSKIFR